MPSSPDESSDNRPRQPMRGEDLGVHAPRRVTSIRSEELLKGRQELEILHAGVRYRLRLTSLGKLILTK